MIAENLSRDGFRVLYPRVNWAGDAPGYVGTEFPLVPLMASLLYPVFGVREWIGRSVSLLFFAFSVPLLFLLVRKVWNDRTAIYGVAVYLFVPLGIFASRAFMPDMAMVTFSLAALYLFAEWLERPGDSRLFAATCLAASLAVLVKLPGIIIGLPMLYIAWGRYGLRLVVRPSLCLLAGLSLIAPAAWYLHAYRVSVSHFPHHMFGAEGIQIMEPTFYLKLFKQATTESLTPLVSAIMLLGVLLPGRTGSKKMFHWWLLAIVAFAFFAGWGHRHQWYLLPLVPVAAAFEGRFCD
jgi:4-amino-4-deoxy-L-arabinose transferase-like glycosyltransferase